MPRRRPARRVGGGGRHAPTGGGGPVPAQAGIAGRRANGASVVRFAARAAPRRCFPHARCRPCVQATLENAAVRAGIAPARGASTAPPASLPAADASPRPVRFPCQREADGRRRAASSARPGGRSQDCPAAGPPSIGRFPRGGARPPSNGHGCARRGARPPPRCEPRRGRACGARAGWPRSRPLRGWALGRPDPHPHRPRRPRRGIAPPAARAPFEGPPDRHRPPPCPANVANTPLVGGSGTGMREGRREGDKNGGEPCREPVRKGPDPAPGLFRNSETTRPERRNVPDGAGWKGEP